MRVGPFKVDFLWRNCGLIVEVDGWESHRMRSAFESDRARDVELKLLGHAVVRFRHRRLTDEPSRVARTLRMLLA